MDSKARVFPFTYNGQVEFGMTELTFVATQVAAGLVSSPAWDRADAAGVAARSVEIAEQIIFLCAKKQA